MTTKTPKRGTAAPTRRSDAGASSPAPSTDQERRECIATAAYFLSKRRQAAGEPADELRDWLDAEREVYLPSASARASAEDKA